MAKQWAARDILELSSMYWKTSALQAGVVLDLFTALDAMDAAGEHAGVASLARAVKSDERAVGMLVTALTAMGFLEMEEGGVHLPEHSRRYLSRKSDEYVGFIVKHHAHIMPAWANLAGAVRTGSATRQTSSSDTDDAAEREAFLMGMFTIAVQQAETVAAALDLSGRTRLLDLGGGPGAYAAFFCLANPGLCATIFDRATSEPIARSIVARFGLEDRVGFVGGDFLRDPLPGGYDAVWLSQVLHGESPKDAAKLLARAGKTLNPGGLLVVQDFMVDDDRRGPEHPALFSLNMLVGTPGGQAYTWSEIEAMARAAGAVRVTRLDVALPCGCGILVGSVPG